MLEDVDGNRRRPGMGLPRASPGFMAASLPTPPRPARWPPKRLGGWFGPEKQDRRDQLGGTL